MGPNALYALALALSPSLPPAPPVSATPAPPLRGGYLAPEDAFLLDFLVHDCLFDPKRASRVRVPVPARRLQLEFGYLWGNDKENTETREGWLVRGNGGEPDRIYFIDGESIVAPVGKIRPVDFEKQCEKRYCKKKSNERHDWGCLISDFREDSETDLVLAAWLHRRGYDGLVAQALAAVQGDQPIRNLRERLARRAYDAMCAAICHGADDEALAHGERLLRLYSDLLDSGLEQAPDIVADLKRRQKGGHSRSADSPKDFTRWDTQKKVSYLIDSLDRIRPPKFSATQRRWDLSDEPAYAALVQLGDAAVPAVIDVVEHDQRLTHSLVWVVTTIYIRSGRDNSPRRFIQVRDVAERILLDILGTSALEPLQPAESEDQSPQAMASRFRKYWSTYGKLSFDDRMMAILTNPKARTLARFEAAGSLVRRSVQRPESWREVGEPFQARSHLLAKYTSPTVADAILNAMKEERDRLARGDDDSHWSALESQYIGILTMLGDQRVGFEMAHEGGSGIGNSD